MEYIRIGGIDMSKYVQASSYKVDSVSSYDKWEDADHNRHFSNVAEHIEGSFELVFFNDSDLNQFLSTLNLVTSDNMSTISLYIGNKNAMQVCVCFLSLSTTSAQEISASNVYKRITCKVYGR